VETRLGDARDPSRPFGRNVPRAESLAGAGRAGHGGRPARTRIDADGAVVFTAKPGVSYTLGAGKKLLLNSPAIRYSFPAF
jgi:hypothetical protein